ncbi:hypothetical protein AAG747_19050 [Rapidithrix thailandica]|uniref:Uncharacterized protein n=1 Tax=Rapidithrix thailandica TaxID=413964 RepID=A0AAW9SAL4_9BACT
MSLFAQNQLTGTWQLSSYIDSVLIHKELCEFSGNPASYCYQITIEPKKTEIDLIGYHEGGSIPIIDQGDNWMKVGYSSEQFFTLELVDEQTLKFEEGKLESTTNIYIDSTIHIFKRKPPVSDLTAVFNQLVEGKYKLKRSEIVFHPNGQLTGLANFSRFKLTINFWEHLPKGFDSILLIRPDGTSEYRKWEIKSEYLILTELERTVDEESGMYEYQVGTESLELMKI